MLAAFSDWDSQNGFYLVPLFRLSTAFTNTLAEQYTESAQKTTQHVGNSVSRLYLWEPSPQ